MFNPENIRNIADVENERLATAERKWRNDELARADIELLKVQDGIGTGNVQDWRDYRNALRDWPEHPEFPNQDYRPKFTYGA